MKTLAPCLAVALWTSVGVPCAWGQALTEADLTLLKLASTWHYVNGKPATHTIDEYARHADFLAREAGKKGATADLAKLVLVNFYVRLKNAELSADRRDLLEKGLPREILRNGIRGALAGIRGEHIPPPFSDAFREDPAVKSGQKWVDNLRANEIGKWSLMVLQGQSNLNIARVFERDFAPRMGAKPMNWESMSRGLGIFDNYSGSLANILDMKYAGKETLTNVVFVTRLETTGLRVDFTGAQKKAMEINEAFGFEEKNKQIGAMFKVQNYAGSMPHAGIVYVPSLKPNDAVRLMLGSSDTDLLKGFSVAVYCDQGRLPEMKIAPYKATKGIERPKTESKGPHLGVWEVFAYEWRGGKSDTPAGTLIWEVRKDWAIDTRSANEKKATHAWDYVIDDSKEPKQIDLGRADGKVHKGIYKIEKDVLTVCFPNGNGPNVDSVPRPTAFEIGQRSDIQMLRLKRMPDTK